MVINKVLAVYFSATGTTKKVIEYIANAIGRKIDAPVSIIDFTLPDARKQNLKFSKDDLVIFGTPVYAGRVPNILLPFLNENIKADNTYAIPVVLFGNRNYDDALKELLSILKKDGFHILAAGAFVGEHAFSKTLAAGRPDESDMLFADGLVDKAVKRIYQSNNSYMDILFIKDEEPLRPYYKPKDRNGMTINILKVKPKTNDNCKRCGLCAEVCPMGSISHEDYSIIMGICIKCGACIKKCPEEAKFFDDEGYLYHKMDLEAMYSRRIEPELF